MHAPATGGGPVTIQYDASLRVVHPANNAALDLVVPSRAVLDLPPAGLGYDCLIGRDVLALCRFVYDGRQGNFTLEC